MVLLGSASTRACTRVRADVLGLAVVFAAFDLAGLAVLSLTGLLLKIPQYQRTTPTISTPSAVLIISGNRSISGYPMVMAVDFPADSGACDMIMYAAGMLPNRMSGGCTTAVKIEEDRTARTATMHPAA